VTVDACYVDQYIYQFWANLVVGHVDRWRVSSYVDFGEYIKKECFLNVWSRYKCVHHRGDKWHLWKQLLHYFWEGLVDRVIVNASHLVSETAFTLVVLKQTLHVVLNGEQAITFLVVSHKHVRVNFVNENFVVQVRLNVTSLLDQVSQTHACAFIVVWLGVDDIDEGAAILYLPLEIVLEYVVSWEIDDVEVNVVISLNRLRFDLLRREEEVGLVGSQLRKYDLLDGTLARSTCEWG
jgi:hypothetical protein